MCNLNVDGHNDEKGTLFVPAAKGGRDTVRVLCETTKNALRFYLVKRKEMETKTNAMFLKNTKVRISKSMLSERLVFILKKAEVYEKGCGYHSFRRAKVWRLKKAGFTEEEINDIMGWKRGSKMSHIYGELDQTEVQMKAADADDIFKSNNSDT